ncbi:hypothetical protein H9X86_11170 [Pseudoflavonifractor capillosus]|uniref:hypothetical protein n=1 Tax=Pseudoflavonifractor capillosus TaxID=106588 RepID=UPI00195B4D92|nr:hypothetical protein [Pseudoflavonifractor capillosus]MBM6897902.1 hypothetical protein [Pseudoflavonifractor capillosus]
MELELAPMPGDHMSLADIEQRLQELGEQVREIVAKAAATKEVQVHAPLLKEIADEMDALKKKRALIESQRQTHEHAFRRIEIATDAMEQTSTNISEWDEALIRQLVDTVKVHSAEKITVYLRGGIEIQQNLIL